MEKLQANLAKIIISRRKELNIRQEDLSELTQIALRTIRDLEKGKGNPSLNTIQKVMYVLGMEVEIRSR